MKFDTTKDGKVVVTIRGVDVFDPSTGAVRTGGTDDIACWFIDTDYDDQSFYVRHAYFLYGGKGTKDGPYDKLKKALRAEIDEGEWAKLYSATSQPFDPPKSGKVAVKVINHFGDEELKVYPVSATGKGRSLAWWADAGGDMMEYPHWSEHRREPGHKQNPGTVIHPIGPALHSLMGAAVNVGVM